MGGSSDDELVRASLGGDKAAFTALIDRHIGSVVKYFGRHSARSEVNDLVQEVILRAWQLLHRFRQEFTFQGWLFLLALKAAGRSRARLARWSGSDETIPLDAISVVLFKDGVRDEHHQEVLDALRAAVRRLDDRTAQIVYLVYDAGLRAEEVSRIMGIGRTTVYRMLEKAHEEIRTRLDEREPRPLRPPRA